EYRTSGWKESSGMKWNVRKPPTSRPVRRFFLVSVSSSTLTLPDTVAQLTPTFAPPPICADAGRAYPIATVTSAMHKSRLVMTSRIVARVLAVKRNVSKLDGVCADLPTHNALRRRFVPIDRGSTLVREIARGVDE